MPKYSALYMIIMLGSVGLPGLCGFIGEFLILIGSFLTYRWWAVVAAAGRPIELIQLAGHGDGEFGIVDVIRQFNDINITVVLADGVEQVMF